jgi:GrpB-like predicted nucleotidyltransferase (UPF0157 family)
MDVDEPIEVVSYDPSWPSAASAEVIRLKVVVAAWPVEIEHIGSTSVPGCAAKPVMDLLFGAPPDDCEDVAAAVAGAGYESLGEAEHGRLYLRRRGSRHYNVHVVEIHGPLWRQNLVFRDYLRAHPDERDRYGDAKRQAARAAPTLLAYSTAKSAVVAEMLDRAETSPGG